MRFSKALLLIPGAEPMTTPKLDQASRQTVKHKKALGNCRGLFLNQLLILATPA
jgi:hypothetical protein